MISISISLVACSFGGKPAVMVEQYALEYPPPITQGLSPMEEVIRLERFSAAQIFNHPRMVYRQKPTLYNDYAYHRWRTNPGDMVGDSILRDLRAAGIFKSVFSWRDMEESSLILKGGVNEFYESDEQGGRKAILSAHLTLMDTTSRELMEQVVFQKNYRYEEPVTDKTVTGFTQAMSRAVERLSRQIITDIHEAIRLRK
jgi:ABC-type uncharacterized transport system auxiliary subunit